MHNCDWRAAEWSACSRACSGGIQSRSVNCMDERNKSIDINYCPNIALIDNIQSCNSALCEWRTSDWRSNCSSNAISVREADCVDSGGNLVDNYLCFNQAKPFTAQSCSYSIKIQSWSLCDESCMQHRNVSCVDLNGIEVSITLCSNYESVMTVRNCSQCNQHSELHSSSTGNYVNNSSSVNNDTVTPTVFLIGVALKSPTHRWFHIGSAFAYTVNGQEDVALNLSRGSQYVFDLRNLNSSYTFYITDSPLGNGSGNVYAQLTSNSYSSTRRQHTFSSHTLEQQGRNHSLTFDVAMERNIPNQIFYQSFTEIAMGGIINIYSNNSTSNNAVTSNSSTASAPSLLSSSSAPSSSLSSSSAHYNSSLQFSSSANQLDPSVLLIASVDSTPVLSPSAIIAVSVVAAVLAAIIVLIACACYFHRQKKANICKFECAENESKAIAADAIDINHINPVIEEQQFHDLQHISSTEMVKSMKFEQESVNWHHTAVQTVSAADSHSAANCVVDADVAQPVIFHVQQQCADIAPDDDIDDNIVSTVDVIPRIIYDIVRSMTPSKLQQADEQLYPYHSYDHTMHMPTSPSQQRTYHTPDRTHNSNNEHNAMLANTHATSHTPRTPTFLTPPQHAHQHANFSSIMFAAPSVNIGMTSSNTHHDDDSRPSRARTYAPPPPLSPDVESVLLYTRTRAK